MRALFTVWAIVWYAGVALAMLAAYLLVVTVLTLTR
jgi:hypothetical protein